jgi:hypothetical protein
MNLSRSGIDTDVKDSVDSGLLNEAVEISDITKDCLFSLLGDYIPGYKSLWSMEDIISVVTSEQALSRPDLLDFGHSHYIIDGICFFRESDGFPDVTIVAFSKDFQVERWGDAIPPVRKYWMEEMEKRGISDVIGEFNRWNWVETIIHETVHSFQNRSFVKVGKEKIFIECGVDFFVGEIGDLYCSRENCESQIFKYHEMTKSCTKLHNLIFERLLRDFGEDVPRLFFGEGAEILSKDRIINDCYQYYNDAVSMCENSL